MFTLFLLPGALLQEAHEGSDARARSDHDDGRAGLEGQAELGLPDIQGHGGRVTIVGGRHVLEPGGGHAHVGAAGGRRILHHHGTDVHRGRVDLQGGRGTMHQRVGRGGRCAVRQLTSPYSSSVKVASARQKGR